VKKTREDMFENLEFFLGKNILVTGFSGFIGNELSAILSIMGSKIFGVQRNCGSTDSFTEKVFQLDLSNFNDVMHAVTVAEPDIVFHLGAVTQVTEARHWPLHTFNVNAVGTMNLLEACRQLNKPDMKIVVASSDKAYGEPLDDDLPLKEDARLRPVHPYDLSKSCTDLIAQSYAKYFDMKIQVTRMANVYGPGDDNFKRLIPGVIRWMLSNQTVIIRSDGGQLRQYLYIDDALKSLFDLAYHMNMPVSKNGESWNFAPKEKHSVLDVVEIIRGQVFQLGIEVLPPEILNEAKDETFAMEISSRKAKKLLGWEAEIYIEQGISNTVEYHYDRLESIKAYREAP